MFNSKIDQAATAFDNVAAGVVGLARSVAERSVVKQFAVTAVCNKVFESAQEAGNIRNRGVAQGSADLAAVKARQIVCGMAVPAMQSALSYVVHTFDNPGEAYSTRRLVYDAAGIVGGGNLPRAFESASRAAFSSTIGTMSAQFAGALSATMAAGVVGIYSSLASDAAEKSGSNIEVKA